MKLITKVANRDPRSTSPCAKPPGPSVCGARSSSTRIVMAMANTPSTSVSLKTFAGRSKGLRSQYMQLCGRGPGDALAGVASRFLERGDGPPVADLPERGRGRLTYIPLRIAERTHEGRHGSRVLEFSE